MAGKRASGLAAGIGAALALGLAPASASAVDLYVDAETGFDGNAECPQAMPCASIPAGLFYADPGDRILLDDGNYTGGITLENDISLEYQNFIGLPGTPAVVDGGAGTAITVANAGGSISGLTLRGDAEAVSLQAPAEITGNTFDELDTTGFGTYLKVEAGGQGSTIESNLFIDKNPELARSRAGVVAFGTEVEVLGNTFTDLQLGVQVGGGSEPDPPQLIEGNQFSGTHTGVLGCACAILVDSPGRTVVRANTFTDAGAGSTTAIFANSGASLVRNDISGHSTGVFAGIDVTGVSLEGDRIWGNTGFGLRLLDNGVSAPPTSATATNVTAVNNPSGSMHVDDSELALGSSIVDGLVFDPSGNTSCAISFSRGPTQGTNPTGCDGFQTTAAPMLADPANGDLHLQAGSPMIDAGNPAAPGAGALDFDGDPRAVIGTPACTNRRDIGADEFVPAPPLDCDPPETTFTKTPPKKTTRKTVRFKFEADEAGTFQCQLDQKPEFGCGSPADVNVKVGRHKFFVTSTDSAGNVELEPAKYGFRRVRG